jgi:hypothetical protein
VVYKLKVEPGFPLPAMIKQATTRAICSTGHCPLALGSLCMHYRGHTSCSGRRRARLTAYLLAKAPALSHMATLRFPRSYTHWQALCDFVRVGVRVGARALERARTSALTQIRTHLCAHQPWASSEATRKTRRRSRACAAPTTNRAPPDRNCMSKCWRRVSALRTLCRGDRTNTSLQVLFGTC